jgi:hypothetical protein
LGYLDKLRALLGGMGLWETERHALLEECAALLPFEKYMAILDKESELDLLMEQLRKHPEEVFSYGKSLSSAFNQEVCDLFVSQIAKSAGRASNRKDYASVCARIKMFAESGYPKKANDLIAELKVEQKRRSAFVDELDKLGAF